jgi:hypothetical protein
MKALSADSGGDLNHNHDYEQVQFKIFLKLETEFPSNVSLYTGNYTSFIIQRVEITAVIFLIIEA